MIEFSCELLWYVEFLTGSVSTTLPANIVTTNSFTLSSPSSISSGYIFRYYSTTKDGTGTIYYANTTYYFDDLDIGYLQLYPICYKYTASTTAFSSHTITDTSSWYSSYTFSTGLDADLLASLGYTKVTISFTFTGYMDYNASVDVKITTGSQSSGTLGYDYSSGTTFTKTSTLTVSISQFADDGKVTVYLDSSDKGGWELWGYNKWTIKSNTLTVTAS